MTLQDKIIGKHPNDGLFYEWTDCQDTGCTEIKRHRYLSEKCKNRQQAIETIAHWLVTYHLSKSKRLALCNRQKILEKYDFDRILESSF